MYKSIIIAILMGVGCSISCKEKNQNSQRTEIVVSEKKVAISSEAKKGAELLDKCIDAHGGMTRWNSFNALEYNLDDKGKKVYQITHLKDRRAYIKSQQYEVGFDGDVAWSVPDAEKVSGGSAAFYYNLDFYFIGVPFLLRDKGVHAVYAGKTIINGKSYESLKITFGPDVGLTPEDVYHCYIDPKTYMLRILTYSISYFDSENAKINSAKVYSEYKEFQGLNMPTRMENFEWDAEAEAMGKSKEHIRLFNDITFFKAVPDTGIFEVPNGAVTEKVH